MEARQVFGSLPSDWLSRVQIEFCPKCGAGCEPLEAGLPHGVCKRCGHVHFVNPSPGVTVVVESKQGVLLCRRSQYAGFGGLWCLPGGHIEYNEDFITAGLGEIREETGLQVEVTGILSVVSTFWEHGASLLAAAVPDCDIGAPPHPIPLPRGRGDRLYWVRQSRTSAEPPAPRPLTLAPPLVACCLLLVADDEVGW